MFVATVTFFDLGHIELVALRNLTCQHKINVRFLAHFARRDLNHWLR